MHMCVFRHPLASLVCVIQTMDEWCYKDRYTCQRIIDGSNNSCSVWLGPHTVGRDSTHMQSLGITDIVLVKADTKAENASLWERFPDIFRYHTVWFGLNDGMSQFSKVAAQIRNVSNVLFLGSTGTSRSAALICAYLIDAFGYSAEAAVCRVAEARKCALISPILRRQLDEFSIIKSAARDTHTATSENRKRKGV